MLLLISRLKKKPDQIIVGYLQVVVMPNGELVHQGKSLGFLEYNFNLKEVFTTNENL